MYPLAENRIRINHFENLEQPLVHNRIALVNLAGKHIVRIVINQDLLQYVRFFKRKVRTLVVSEPSLKIKYHRILW